MRAWTLLLLPLLLDPALARAQAAEEAPKAEVIRAVERGLFVETDVGAGFIVNKINDRGFGLALMTGFFVGYDILPILSLSVGATGIAASVSDSPETPAPRGDLFFVSPMVQVQFALLTTERNFVYLRGAAGFALGLPSEIDGAAYGGNGPIVSLTGGFERYTKLRHFSIGAQAGVVIVTQPAVGIGIQLVPTLKYTF